MKKFPCIVALACVACGAPVTAPTTDAPADSNAVVSRNETVEVVACGAGEGTDTTGACAPASVALTFNAAVAEPLYQDANGALVSPDDANATDVNTYAHVSVSIVNIGSKPYCGVQGEWRVTLQTADGQTFAMDPNVFKQSHLSGVVDCLAPVSSRYAWLPFAVPSGTALAGATLVMEQPGYATVRTAIESDVVVPEVAR